MENINKKKGLINPVMLIIKYKLFLFFAFLTLSGFLITYLYIFRDLPSPNKLSFYQIPQTTKIFDRNDRLLYEIFAGENRTLVKLKQVPLFVKQATIAIEDKDFYKHAGVNPIGGILRALREIIIYKKLQGGSTITQQLVKNALLTPERTLRRKLKEIVLAFWTEKLYSKDEVLEMYLNQVPYGGTAWGIEAASQTYFGKKVSDLTLSEATLLAGLPAAPTLYSPFGAHPELAKVRQEEVLQRMVDEGHISQQEAEDAKQQELKYKVQQTNIRAPHFVMYVKDLLAKTYGEKLVAQGGLKVTTTLDLTLQEFAQSTVASEVAKLKDLKVGNGATLITRPATGEILAMVGSKDYFATDSGNVNVTLAMRQPGSSIKPLNYATGLLSKKVTATSLFLDVPTCFQVANLPLYCPRNYDGSFHGPVQLRFALGNSYNVPAVKMLALNGVENMIATASAMGISTFRDPSRYGLSLTLGGGEVTMLDMATAFGVFANSGIRKDLVAILKVQDYTNKVLQEYQDANFIKDVYKNPQLKPPSALLINGKQVLTPEVAFIVSHILLDNNARSAAFGSNSELVIRNNQGKNMAVSVKTGTTDDKRDNWTIGYTPNFLVASWVGNNDNSPMHPYLTSGVTGAAPIWNKITTYTLTDQSDIWPRKPQGIVGTSVCALSGKLPGDSGCQTRYEYFIPGTISNEVENLKQAIFIDKATGQVVTNGQTDNVEAQEHQVVTDVLGNRYCIDCPTQDQPSLVINPNNLKKN